MHSEINSLNFEHAEGVLNVAARPRPAALTAARKRYTLFPKTYNDRRAYESS